MSWGLNSLSSDGRSCDDHHHVHTHTKKKRNSKRQSDDQNYNNINGYNVLSLLQTPCIIFFLVLFLCLVLLVFFWSSFGRVDGGFWNRSGFWNITYAEDGEFFHPGSSGGYAESENVMVSGNHVTLHTGGYTRKQFKKLTISGNHNTVYTGADQYFDNVKISGNHCKAFTNGKHKCVKLSGNNSKLSMIN